MSDMIVGWFKSLFGGKGTTQIGKENSAISGATSGENSPVVMAARDVHINLSMPAVSQQPQIVLADHNAKQKARVEGLQHWIRTNGAEKPLSQILPRALELAQLVEDRDFEHWVRMELFGYNREGRMNENDVVPEYRQVTGRHLDQAGQMLQVRGSGTQLRQHLSFPLRGEHS